MLGQYRHDGVTVLAVQCGRRLIGKNGGGIAGNRARDGNALLLAAAEFDRVGLRLVRLVPTVTSASVGLTEARRGVARRERRKPDGRFPRGKGRKQMVGLKNKTNVIAPELGELLGPKSLRGTPTHADSCRCVGASMQPSMERSVVFPLPEGPMRSVNSPPGKRPS